MVRRRMPWAAMEFASSAGASVGLLWESDFPRSCRNVRYPAVPPHVTRTLAYLPQYLRRSTISTVIAPVWSAPEPSDAALAV